MGGEDADKIVRIPGETLLVNLSPEEVKYREKYLPDPKKLTDEKLVCTVCSVSLANDIHKGKDIYIHGALHVLVCQACYTFYGDGCFSVDEDGDDKYCRWCGQGGTLFLCSTCTCAFCQKCVKQNLKPSVLADLDNDDWKCYICNPRPLFGCRTICWGAEELNKVGKDKEKERVQKQKERLDKLEEKKKSENGRRSRKASSSEDDLPSKKRKKANDSDSSSPEVMPKKRSKRESRSAVETGSLNGSISRTKKKRRDSSSDSELSEVERKSSRPSRASVKKNLKPVDGSEDSDTKSKSKTRKKKSKETSDESSDDNKRKPKQRHAKKKADSSDDESDNEKYSKKKRSSKKKKPPSDSSSDEKEKKKKFRKKKKESSDESSSDDTKKKSKKGKKKKDESSDEDSEDDSSRKNRKSRVRRGSYAGTKKKGDSDSDSKKEKHDDADDEVKSKVKDSSNDNILVKKRIKLAILWLNNAVKDISELGSLISMRATKFSSKKINVENLKTYDDVLNTVSKLKQLISGIHSNYEHIEKSLDAHLKPWKIMTGLEEPENEKTVEGEVSIAGDTDVSKNDNASSTMNGTESNDVNTPISELTAIAVDVSGDVEKKEDKEMTLHWSGLSADDDSDNAENNATKALISKADETLRREDEKDVEQCNLGKSETDKNEGIEDADKEKSMDKEDLNKESESHENSQADSQSDSENKMSKKKSGTESPKTKSDKMKASDKQGAKENKKEESTKVEDYKKQNLKEDKKEETNKVKDSVKSDSKESKKDKSPKKSSKPVIEESDSESEKEQSPKKKKSPQKTPIKTSKEEKSKKSELDEDKKLSGEEGSRESDKEKSKSTGRKADRKNDSGISNSPPTPETFCTIESFSEQIKNRWMIDKEPEKMNLKTSVGLDSSEESDTSSKQALLSKENVKKKTVDNEITGENCKKTKLADTHLNSDDDDVKDCNKKIIIGHSLKEKHKEKSKKSRKVKTEREEIKEGNNSENKRKKSKEERNTSEDEEYNDIKKNMNEVKKDISENKTKKRKEDSEDEKKVKKIKKKNMKVEDTKSAVAIKEKNRKSSGQKMSLSDEDSENEKDDKKIKEEDGENEKRAKKTQKKNMEEEDKNSAVTKKEKNNKSTDKKEKNEYSKERKMSFSEEESEKDGSIKEKKYEKGNKNKGNDSEDEIMEVTNVKTEKAVKLNSLTENKTKFVGLDSSSEETFEIKSRSDNDESLANNSSKAKDKCIKKRSVRDQSRSISTMLESSDEDEEPDSKKSVMQNSSSDKENRAEIKEEENSEARSPSPLVLSSTDSSDSEIITTKKRKKKASSNSDSDFIGDSDKEKNKKKRKLLRCRDSSNESGGSDDEESKLGDKSTQGESPGKGGRKNIKKIKAKDDLEEATKEAAEEEKERRRRIEERQKLFNEIFEVQETKRLEKLVLDFDPDTKEELISVHQDLVEKMKPHQAKGVKFMWDSCFESLKRLKKEKGSGCILAHCMGLGKTFQVVSLVHTVLTHEDTQVRTVMVVCPLSTVLNWYNEFDKWLDGVEGGNDIEVFHLTKCKQNVDRARELRRWQHNGGVLIIGYEMFRNLACETSKKFRAKMKKDFQETLIDPGADLIVCDEGHMLKNEATALSKAMSKVKTLRRIVLTGTPMQNNLKEYHCMVQFVKPSLLGTRKEFLNRFVNPITNGQFVDSTDRDVKIMKRRAHVLHKMLEGLVQRFDYNVLTPFLPPKHEYVVSLCLSELQVKLYQHYLENFSQQSSNTKAGSQLFMDWQALGRIWTHPRVLKLSTDKDNLRKEKLMMMESDEEGSLKDFIDDGEESESTAEETSDDNSSNASIKSNKKKVTRGRGMRATRSSARNEKLLDSEEEEINDIANEDLEENSSNKAWWSDMVEPHHLDDMRQSGKLVMLFAILKESEMIEDKVLVFSQSLFSLDLIEYFLDKIDAATQEGEMKENLGNHQGTWARGLDYFRLDGSTSSENRNIWCKAFNRDDNARARLFLISTRAGGLGINLTAANRVIIFDASWNPSHDVQSIFRVYRFGQKKPCYIYRFIAHGTMEEKVYDRQVAKQSMSNRVVDEQQVHRHFSMNDLNELYTFTPPSKKEDRPTPVLPTDALMAEILTQCNEWIEKYHEHHSLLENVVEEELNEEERKLAWEDYENDKKGLLPPPAGNTANAGMFNNFASPQMEHLRQALRNKYPGKSEQEINQYAMMLFYQVKQQQMIQGHMQAGGSMPRPAFVNKNMTPEQMFNLQQQQMRIQYLQQMQMQNQALQAANMKNIQPKQSVPINYQQQMMMQQQANLARLQMQQMQQKFPSNLLLDHLTQPPLQTPPDISQMASLQVSQLQNMAKRIKASKEKKGVTITEIPKTPPVKSPSDSKS